MSSGVTTSAAFQARFNVSRETLDRLEIQEALLRKWNPRINLVSRGDEDRLWDRHFADSAQLWRLCPDGARTWMDLGSGAGFPGLVIAALAAEARPDLRVMLVECDARKAAFLGAVSQASGLAVEILPTRIEDLPASSVDVVSARALAPLGKLLEFANNLRAPSGIGLFPKGQTVHKELADAQALWQFDHRIHRSLTDPNAAVIEIGAIAGARTPA